MDLGCVSVSHQQFGALGLMQCWKIFPLLFCHADVQKWKYAAEEHPMTSTLTLTLPPSQDFGDSSSCLLSSTCCSDSCCNLVGQETLTPLLDLQAVVTTSHVHESADLT